MEWRAFEVDGETFYWTAYPSTDDGEPMQYLNVARAPNIRGVGRVYAAGTEVTEADAIDTVRLFKEHRREIPPAPPD